MHSFHAVRPRRPALLVTAVITLVAGCSSSTSAPAASPAGEAGRLPSAHVYAVAIDPGDHALRWPPTRG